jgi:hypothetical protein
MGLGVEVTPMKPFSILAGVTYLYLSKADVVDYWILTSPHYGYSDKVTKKTYTGGMIAYLGLMITI